MDQGCKIAGAPDKYYVMKECYFEQKTYFINANTRLHSQLKHFQYSQPKYINPDSLNSSQKTLLFE